MHKKPQRLAYLWAGVFRLEEVRGWLKLQCSFMEFQAREWIECPIPCLQSLWKMVN